MNYKSISLISGTLLLSTLSANGQKKDSKPNIIFILCDDMGYGDLGCYGQPFIRTPHIDAMASEGMRFTQAYAGSPVSAPSRASFMTGQHTGHCEVRGNKEYWGNSPIIMYGNNKEYSVVGQHPYDPDHVILPEIMKDNGYTTGMFGKWAGGYEGSCSTPDKRGIDEYYGYICQFQAHLYYPNFLNRYSKALGDTGVVRIVMDENIKYPMYGPEYQKRSQYSADMIHEKAMEWLDQQDTKQPFFGIFTYTLPHAELVQPEDSILNEYKAKFDPDKVYKGSKGSRYNAITHTHAQFAAMITRLDYYVGEVLKKLKEKGLDENTLVIFSSDNGPHEEGGADPTFFGRDGKLRGLKRQCHEGGIRIPYGTVYKSSDNGAIGVKGTVMDAIREYGIEGTEIYACGPTPMLRAIQSYALEHGIEAQLSLEERMACGVGACLACVCKSKEIDDHSQVKNKRVCKDGPVFYAEEVEL